VLLAVFALPLLRSSSTSTMSAQEWITVLLVMTFAVTAMLLLGFSGLPPVEVKPRTNDLRSVAILGWLVTPAIWRRLASAPQKTRQATTWFLLAAVLCILSASVVGGVGVSLFPRSSSPTWEPMPNTLVDPAGTDFSGILATVAVEIPPGSTRTSLASFGIMGLIVPVVLLMVVNITANTQALGGLFSRICGLPERGLHVGFTFLLVAWLIVAGSSWGSALSPFLTELGLLTPAMLLNLVPFVLDASWPRWGHKYGAAAGILAGSCVVLALSEPVRQVLTARKPMLVAAWEPYFDSTAGLVIALGVNVTVFIAVSLISYAVFGSKSAAVSTHPGL